MSAAAARARGGWGTGFLGLSALLHAAALAAVLSAGREMARAAPQQPVALVWDSREDGAGDEADSAALPGAAPAEAVAPPEVAPPVTPPAESAPAEPALVPPSAAPAATPPAEPTPLPEASALLPPPPPPPPIPARPAAPQPAPTRTVWAPPRPAPDGEGVPLASRAGTVAGAVTPARPAGGVANPAPDYPRSSRVRGQEGRVTLLVQVDAEGRVLDLSVLGSSGHAALDESAARTVRRWLFEPARQGGQAVFSTVTVGITFRLEGDRRW